MSAPRLSTGALSQYLKARKLPAARPVVVLVRAEPVWDGPAQFTLTHSGGADEARTVHVAAALSPLAVFEQTLHHLDSGAGNDVLAVLTNREEAELGDNVLALVHRQRVDIVEPWEVVRNAFGVTGIDGRLTAHYPWAAEALIDAAPPGGWPRANGSTLDLDTALAQLAVRRLALRERLNFRPADLDINALFHWSLVPGAPDTFNALRDAERDGLAGYLTSRTGNAAKGLLALVAADHGPDAVAFGLVCAALWTHAQDTADAEVFRARGRAERYFGEPSEHAPAATVSDADVSAFAASAEEFVSGVLASHLGRTDDAASRLAAPSASAVPPRQLATAILDRAATLTRQFGAESAARYSPLLRAGFDARLAETATALARCVEQYPVPSVDVAGLVDAVKALATHRLADKPDARPRVLRAVMAQRLVQWLAEAHTVDSPPCSERVDTVAAGLELHMVETAWVDHALEYIHAGGESDQAVKAAFAGLYRTVRARRRELDRVFAARLAAWTASGTDPGSMLTVETFLRRVVAPVVKAGERGTMLIVLDGMSAAVATELGEQLHETWAEFDPVGTTGASAGPSAQRPRRRAMAAILPTLTNPSRTSLFAGETVGGGQDEEKKRYAAHRFWGGKRAVLFHKDDLRGRDGAAFGPKLTAALEDPDAHVAVVINVIDDLVHEGRETDRPTWQIDAIGKLRALLAAAAAQGRAVVVTSDHGHVVEHDGERIPAERALSARHRASGGPLDDAEVELRGPRVVTPDGSQHVVALWNADAHYGSRQAGYHGGASLAEVAIPVLALLPFGAAPPKGWRELGTQQPRWWALSPMEGDGTAIATTAAADKSPVSSSRVPRRSGADKARQEAAGQQSLPIELLRPAGTEPAKLETGQAAVSAVAVDRDPLLTALLASEVFQSQCAGLARKPDLAKVEAALGALLEAHGTLPVVALAQRSGVRPERADGFAATLRQILNFDSVQVLATLADGRTLRLETRLLREQFGLPGR
jgi:hypothetical protein